MLSLKFLSMGVLTLILLLNWRVPLHNMQLYALAKDLSAIDHPQPSSFIGGKSMFGNLGAASSHCDYFVGQLRSTSLAREELVAHYANTRIPPPEPIFGDGIQTRLWFFDRKLSILDPLHTVFNSREPWGMMDDAQQLGNLYVVYAEALDGPSQGDIRCL